MLSQVTSVGLDVHARSVAACAIGPGGEVFEASLPNDVAEVVGWLAGLEGDVEATYEAGPTGFGLARAVQEAGMVCRVAAPAKILRPAGERVKTDRRDAMFLARLVKVGEIVDVAVPDGLCEAARDLVRARDDARGDLMAARHRVSTLLLRHGIVWDRTAWTKTHLAWLASQRFEFASRQAAYDAGLEAIHAAQARRDRLDEQIGVMAGMDPWADLVGRLACLRGVSTLTAFGLVVEIDNWTRFTPRTLGAYVGLVPSEYSSGNSRVQGGITRTGNSHARRLLIEAAWHHRRPYKAPSADLRARWEKSSTAARVRADQANRRLNHRWRGFDARKKKPVVANTAIARELAAWCWSLATLED